jgi:hypothetical protein
LLNPNRSLRIVIITVLQEVLRTMNEQQCHQVLGEIQERFEKNWEVLLPFVLLITKLYKVPPKLGKDCVANVFPLILRCPVTMELFGSVFSQVAGFFTDKHAFFSETLRDAGPCHISDARIVSFGMECPCEFLDVVIPNPRSYPLIELLFQRWPTNQDRVLLLEFLLYMVKRVPKNMTTDFERVYQALVQRIPYVDNCKQYLAFGNDEGVLLVISKESAGLLWKQQLFANQISFVSVAPNSQRVLALSVKDKVITWIIAAKHKAGGPFELAGTVPFHQAAVPAMGVWKGDSRVVLLGSNGQALQEESAPKSFSFRLGRG